jgi:acetyl-CoA C-acetyltransferase
MGAERCAVVGVGQTHHKARRADVSMVGLVREACTRALEDAGVDWSEIDCIVMGKAPDMFEGVHQPSLYMVDSLGIAGKPIFRVHTAGSVGGSTAVVAGHLISAGIHKRVLAVAWEKQSESNAMWALSHRFPFQPPVAAGAGGYFAPLIRAYIRRSGAPGYTGFHVAAKDRFNGCLNEYAHLKMADITPDKVAASPMLWDPVRYLETCPSSDGACAVVLTDERTADASQRQPAWIHGTAMRSEPLLFSGRDQVNPMAGRKCAQSVYDQAGITRPRKEIDVAEIYVPFSWFEPMWLENLGLCDDEPGWKMVLEGETAMPYHRDTGAPELPVNPSGGVLCTNPIGASGMLRFAEAANQVRGFCGRHQVPDAQTALGHAYGGGSQFFAMWIVRGQKP